MLDLTCTSQSANNTIGTIISLLTLQAQRRKADQLTDVSAMTLQMASARV